MRWSWIVLVACVACSGESSIPSDAAAQLDAAVCATPVDCPCFTNYDCPPSHACLLSGGTTACIAGPRGSGVAGATCASERDCASALCVEDAEGGRRCSDLCRTADTCPALLPRCIVVNGEGVCSPEPPSSLR